MPLIRNKLLIFAEQNVNLRLGLEGLKVLKDSENFVHFSEFSVLTKLN